MDSQHTANGTTAPNGKTSGINSYTSGVPGDVEEPITFHLLELRNRLAIVLIWLFLGIILAFPFSAKGMLLIWKEFISTDIYMTAYSPLEWIFARLKLCLVFALAISIPQLFYQLYRFAGKGLYPHEKRFFLKVIPASFLLFIFGVVIGYFIVLPVMFKYILFYSGDAATAQLSVQDTLSAVTTILAGFGIVFQLPLLVVFAVKMGLIEYQTLKKQRILVYSVIMAVSLFLSPDPTFIAQILVAFLLVVLFEFSLLLIRLF
ncbi:MULTISPECIES: twin-arginine translocase subunit TatC [Methanosarcina]|uniref:Sec-independent protein translocase protein TatC n=2 Tax=Methanosarcina barkeri TaxID=2208 RepID=A0A0E3QUV1_METBA|nr:MULTISPECIES: twin-arginine translocase subunit TatC [Methanosarcina]AKB54380.1 Twin-arginine translocation protein TatC [Methanosarcina barkeri MS]AKJ38093.1 Sec-independent protein translocase TatC2 [Methanosarcina barkeri CM1]OED04820.1 twin arginine-targeting protein translocase TatC [Methanosarcina sp. A14]